MTTMNAKDSISAAMAECYVTIDGKRYNFMQAIGFEAHVDKTKIKVPILGKPGRGTRSVGWVGRGTATAHYNQSVMRLLLQKYKNTGEDTYFDIQVTNEDPTSSVGRQTVILTDCCLDGGTLAKFDADGDFLDEKISFTFDDFHIAETFGAKKSKLDRMWRPVQ